jgi:hypothetical protein
MLRILILFGLLLITGCAAPGAGRLPEPRTDHTIVITGQEIAAFPGTDVYHLIRHSRPLWLQTRGPADPAPRGGVRVYMDGVALGGVEQLRALPLMGLARVEYMSAPRATLRFGTGHPHGAIELIYAGSPRGD